MQTEATIYSYNPELASGTLKSTDGQLFFFSKEDWKSNQSEPKVGDQVRFTLEMGGPAGVEPIPRQIVLISEPQPPAGAGAQPVSPEVSSDHQAQQGGVKATWQDPFAGSGNGNGGNPSDNVFERVRQQLSSPPSERDMPKAAPGRAPSLLSWFLYCMRFSNLRFAGRASRREFWGFMLGFFIIMLICSMIVNMLMPYNSDDAFNVLVFIAILFEPFKVCVSVRRLHDVNLSGYWYLLLYTPLAILAAIPYLVLMVWPGNPGANKYGNPFPPRR